MKHFAGAVLLFLTCLFPQTVTAQSPASWVDVSPAGEQFTFQMPQQPAVKTQKGSFAQFNIEGDAYTLSNNGVDYTVWSLQDKNFANFHPVDGVAYLDASADLVWESLLKPLRDNLPKDPNLVSRMTYKGGVSASGDVGWIEYTLRLGSKPGVVRIHTEGQRIYVLSVLNVDPDGDVTKRFLGSFQFPKPEPVPAKLMVPQENPLSPNQGQSPGVGPPRGGGVGPAINNGPDGKSGMGMGPRLPGNVGGGDAKPGVGVESADVKPETDYNRTFASKEVTEKARILSNPNPEFTESARKYSVSGMVRIRATLARTGQVTNIAVISGLPHGLTYKAIEAAKQVKFIPATKDGHTVSQYIMFEYTFSMY